jgi:cytochrome c biogenesis DsbD-like protein
MAAVGLCGVLTSGAQGQTLAPKPGSLRHISVEPGQSAPDVAPGATLMLFAEVTPAAGVHVYAPGAKAFDFIPVSIVLTPNASISAGKPRFPPAQTSPPGALDEKVPIYGKAFRISQPVLVRPTVKRGEVLTISGTVNYQACDDRLCYPPSSVPVHWTVSVK